MQKEIVLSIKKTLAYFDIFDYPLTTAELYNFLWDCPTIVLSDVFYSVLQDEIKIGSIRQMNGFYFFPGREEIVEIRMKNILLIEKKMKIAHRAIKLISLVPYVRAVFVCNTLSAGWPNEDSDIDLFIVSADKRIWLVRMLVTLFMSIMNLRRGQKNISDRVCLSFYVSESGLNLAKVSIDTLDIYLVYWLLQLLPIYGGQEYYRKVLSENTWINNFVKNSSFNYHLLPIWEVKLGKIQESFRNSIESILNSGLGDIINNLFKKIQLKKISGNTDFGTRISGKSVVTNDEMLKFHENDRRLLYKEMWEVRINNY